MKTNGVNESKSEELCGYEVEQKSIPELKKELYFLEAEKKLNGLKISYLENAKVLKDLFIENYQLIIENQKKDQEIERLKRELEQKGLNISN